MTCTQYLVHPADSGGWTLDLQTRIAGPYATRNLALQVALAEAALLRAKNNRVCIVVNDARGEVTSSRCMCARFDRYLHMHGH